jgi:hypothetical protein
MSRIENITRNNPDQQMEQAKSQYGYVGKLLAEGKIDEAKELMSQARKLELQAKEGYREVGRLLGSGSTKEALALMRTSRETEISARDILHGEQSTLPKEIQHIIERAEQSAFAFTPAEMHYIANRLLQVNDFHPNDVQMFQRLSSNLKHNGFVEDIDPNFLSEKIQQGFTNIEMFFDAQAPEGQIIIAALQYKAEESNLFLTE